MYRYFEDKGVGKEWIISIGTKDIGDGGEYWICLWGVVAL